MTTRLPVIVGFGGIGPAGRSSFHHAYKRTVIENLSAEDRRQTLTALGAMMGLIKYENRRYVSESIDNFDIATIEKTLGQQILDGTLIRRLQPSYFDPDQVPGNKIMQISGDVNNLPASFVTDKDQLPDPLPDCWQVTTLDESRVQITITGTTEIKVDSRRKLTVQSAGQLPAGFEPNALYNSRFHPRGLQMAIIAASDAVRSIGIDWSHISDAVRPDEIAVYASSAMGQLGHNGAGGMLQARLHGNRVSSKQLPLGLNQMPADFINAYVLGSIGTTAALVGACASFLYNLRAATEDIQSGRRRVVVVGNAEAPLLSEVIEGYAAMSALATDANLCKLDGTDSPDYQRASRPFGENCGFTLAESAQYFVLFDDELAVELGADIHGAVLDVFVNADGFKKSISAPGPGNYVTLSKALASARAVLGEQAIREQSFVQAHGSSTPQNRVTESRIFDDVAKAFNIHAWPVTAIKAFLGHSLAPASGDQLVNSLGILKYGLMPGIKTIDHIADDVFDERLHIATSDVELGDNANIAFLNSKGFGGNNATGVVVSPRVAVDMLTQRYGQKKMKAYQQKREMTQSNAAFYDAICCRQPMRPIYRFGEGLIDESLIEFDGNELKIPGYERPIDLDLPNRYTDMVPGDE